MQALISSARLKNSYTPHDRDEHIFEITDLPGLQVVRKYPPTSVGFEGKRMFIKLFLRQEERTVYISGGVDIVRKQEEGDSNWTIVFPSDGFFQKPTNFRFGKSEGVSFDSNKELIVFKKEEYNIRQFIDLLEKNHLSDMFFWSRFFNFAKVIFLHQLFFLTDDHFKITDFIFKNRAHIGNEDKSTKKFVHERGDPLFHYFRIYKHLFGSAIFYLLPIVYKLSVTLTTAYFTVTNPFLLFGALFLLFLLEKISDLLDSLKESNFIADLVKSTFESRGPLKKYRV
ncbi:MAG TPA: hypothetical protein VD967_01795 [Candidatus Paceibacterota bacterium]|nr:hypothetical protein [Candidatus Paceibacterota bacterium]